MYSSNVVGAKCPGIPSAGSASSADFTSFPNRTSSSFRGASPAREILSNGLFTCGEVYRPVRCPAA